MQTTASAIDSLLCAIGDPLDDLHHIGPGHPEFNTSLLLRAAIGVVAKVPSALASIRHTLQLIDCATASPSVLAHAAAAEAWVSGDPVRAAERYAAIVATSPTDLLALRLAQSCFFFLGWHDRLAAICDGVLRNWPDGAEGLRHALAIASFAHAEAGNTRYAELIGREALALNRACPLGVHAVAHAYAASGQNRAGASWMHEQHAQWETESRMRTHNAWHLAIFELDSGKHEHALEILDRWLLPASHDSLLDACDATTLMWRLELEGLDAGKRWQRLSDAFDQSTPGFWPYIDLHAGFAHLQAMHISRAHRLRTAVRACTRGDDYAALRARKITLPGLNAMWTRAIGQPAKASDMFAALQPLLAEAGGSGAQLEIFYRFASKSAAHSSCAPPAWSRRHFAGGNPEARLNARANAASDR